MLIQMRKDLFILILFLMLTKILEVLYANDFKLNSLLLVLTY